MANAPRWSKECWERRELAELAAACLASTDQIHSRFAGETGGAGHTRTQQTADEQLGGSKVVNRCSQGEAWGRTDRPGWWHGGGGLANGYIYATAEGVRHDSSYLEIQAWAVAIARKWWHRVCTMTTEPRPRAVWAQTGIGEENKGPCFGQGKAK